MIYLIRELPVEKAWTSKPGNKIAEGEAATKRGAGRGFQGETMMPNYEYYCRQCDRNFTVYMSIKDHETEQVRCAHCQGTQVEQVLTSFVAVTSKKS